MDPAAANHSVCSVLQLLLTLTSHALLVNLLSAFALMSSVPISLHEMGFSGAQASCVNVHQNEHAHERHVGDAKLHDTA
jgi:hypothetical protein